MNIQAQLPATEGAAAVAELAGPLVVPSLADPGIWGCLGVGRGRCCLHGSPEPFSSLAPCSLSSMKPETDSQALCSFTDLSVPGAPDV